jgi:hypothetical protein
LRIYSRNDCQSIDKKGEPRQHEIEAAVFTVRSVTKALESPSSDLKAWNRNHEALRLGEGWLQAKIQITQCPKVHKAGAGKLMDLSEHSVTASRGERGRMHADWRGFAFFLFFLLISRIRSRE